MSKKPYSGSTAKPADAQVRIRKALIKFGVDSIGFSEDLKELEVKVSFVHNGYPVCIPVNYGNLAKMYLEDEPYSLRRRCSRKEYEEKNRAVSYKAAFSILEDFLKSQLVLVELGAFSFEEVFVSYFIGPGGQRLGEYFKRELPGLIAGQKALGDGK